MNPTTTDMDVVAPASAHTDPTAQDAGGSAPATVQHEAHRPPAEGVAAADPRVLELATKVEALLITSSKALNPRRIGEALGLIKPEEPPVQPSTGPSTDPVVQGSPAPEIVIKPRRRPRTQSGPSPLDLIAGAVAHLNTIYQSTGRSFRIESLAGGYRLVTLPQFGTVVAALHQVSASSKLSRAAVETLAIIAYKQPMTRAKLEAVRGCACGEVLKSLLDRRLITIAGRAEELGRPLLYATSKAFLNAFGLSSLKDLPSAAEMGLKG